MDTSHQQNSEGESKKTRRPDGGPYSCTTTISGSKSSVSTLIEYDIDDTLDIKEEIIQDVCSPRQNEEFMLCSMVGIPSTKIHDPYEFMESGKSSIHALSVSHVPPSICSEIGYIPSKNAIQPVSEAPYSPGICFEDKVYHYCENSISTNSNEHVYVDNLAANVDDSPEPGGGDTSEPDGFKIPEPKPDQDVPSEEEYVPSFKNEDEPCSENFEAVEIHKSTEYPEPLQVDDVDSAVTISTEKKDNMINDKACCPLCFEEVGNFSRHLLREHGDDERVKKILSLPKGSEKRAAIMGLRRNGNFVLMQQTNTLKPVRLPKKVYGENQKERVNVKNYFACVYCLGYFAKSYLWRHKKICSARSDSACVSRNHLSESQTLIVSTGMLGNYLNKGRLKEEVLNMMKADEISYAAKKDPLICLYGEFYLKKQKRGQMNVPVSNKMREIARLKLSLQDTMTFENLIDVLKPHLYNEFVAAVKVISGFDPEKKAFRAASLALHMGTNIQTLCLVAKKAIINKNPLFGRKDSLSIKAFAKEIDDLNKMVKTHWCSDISSLANKVLNGNSCLRPKLIPLTKDVMAFNNYITSSAKDALEKLKIGENQVENYKILAECTFALTLILNRKRIAEVQFLEIETYAAQSSDRVTQQESISGLTDLEKALCSSFKRVVVFGEGIEAVAVLFTKQMQKFVEALLEIRKNTNIVSKSNKYLFAASGSENRWMNGGSVLRRLAKKSGAEHPEHLTSSKFRKQIAVILQLMNFERNEIEQMVKFMGHTEKTHMEFLRMHDDVYQTAKVAKVLLLMDAGKGEQFKGKRLQDIQLTEDEFCMDDDGATEEESEENMFFQKELSSEQNSIPTRTSNCQESGNVGFTKKPKLIPKSQKKKSSVPARLQKSGTRVPWSQDQKQLVLQHFKNHVIKKKLPKKDECLNLIAKSGKIMKGVEWSRIKTLVYNSYRIT